MLALLAPLASLLGMDLEALRERIQRQAVVYGIVGVLALICFTFLLVAANSALAQWVGPIVAPLIIAGTALLIALVVFLIGRAQEAAAARREAAERRSAETLALITSAAITAAPLILKSSLLREVGIPAGGALLAAYLLMRRSKGTATRSER
jgi:hypothetical protein